jgi:serine/threonine protein phosphatase PrpC
MRTKTQMAFFQPKNQISIRKNQEKLNILSDLNSNFNYKLSSKMKNFSLEKRKITKIKNISSISEISPKLNQNQEKKESIKSISNQNKLLLSNIHFFKRKINNKIKLNSNHNSAIEDIKKNKYYFKNDYKYKNSHFDSQNSLPKIKVMRNPLQISLEKETNIFKKINSKSQRNILNFPSKTNLKIVYKLKGRNFSQNNLDDNISLEEILNEEFTNYQKAKHSENTFDKIISYGVNTYKGVIRNYNEDRVTILINALINKEDNNIKKNLENLNISYFSIYDGHAGNKCCEFLKKYLHHYIFESEFFPLNPIKALQDGFNVCENKFMSLIQSDNEVIEPSGSCAIVILILNDMCYIANLGDSRALYSCNDGKKFLQISRDHKPNDPLEKIRIYKAGGSISKTLNNSPHANILKEKEKLDRTAKIPFRINPGRLAVSYF